jgi:hypothetical protein
MTCGTGAIQTHGTCWFYSILNGFLLSEAGQKVLYEQMLKFYKGLSTEEKTFFRDGIEAPCPRGPTVKPIYFYKFLDQYLCFMSGPRAVPRRAGLSPNLFRNINFKNKVNLNSGANPSKLLFPVLDRLGFKGEYEILQPWLHKNQHVAPEKPKLKISLSPHVYKPGTIKGYDLMCAAISLTSPARANDHIVCGYVCKGNAFLFDPNFGIPIPCKWWKYEELQGALKTITNKYRPGFFNYISISYSVYVRRSLVRRVHPACLRTYKNKGVAKNTPANVVSAKRRTKSIFRVLFPKIKTRYTPNSLPAPNSVSPVVTRSRGAKKKRRVIKTSSS